MPREKESTPREKDFENLLARYPELIEGGLRLIGQQVRLYGGICDLLFADARKTQLIVEVKWGPIRRDDMSQILDYAGSVWSEDDPDIRAMLIGTWVPPNIERALDRQGIEHKRISHREILQFVTEKGDREFISIFDSEDNRTLSVPKSRKDDQTHISQPKEHNGHPQPHPTAVGCRPALLAVVENTPLNDAFEEFRNGKERIQFGVGTQLRRAMSMPITTVYFKPRVRPGEVPAVVAKARLLDITDVNRPQERLAGRQGIEQRFYYSFNLNPAVGQISHR